MLPDHEWSFMNNQESQEFDFVVRAVSSVAWNLSVSNGYYNELILACNEVLSAINVEISNSN